MFLEMIIESSRIDWFQRRGDFEKLVGRCQYKLKFKLDGVFRNRRGKKR